jgi:hypothetical protein
LWFLGLVVAVGVQDQFAEDPAVGDVHDADVPVVDEDLHLGALVGAADADVVQPGVVADGDGAAGIDAVVADAPVSVDGAGWAGFRSGFVCFGWGAALQ